MKGKRVDRQQRRTHAQPTEVDPARHQFWGGTSSLGSGRKFPTRPSIIHTGKESSLLMDSVERKREM